MVILPAVAFGAIVMVGERPLWRCVTHYPWGTPRCAKHDLNEARRLIEKHGYWWRKEELEDAEGVIVK